MDIEFVNAYIARQKALIDELQSKLLISETHQQLLRNNVQVLSEKLAQANDTIEQLNKKSTKKITPQDA